MYASVCVVYNVKEGLSRSEQLVRYFYNAPPLGVAYCLAKRRLALIQRQPEDFATSILSPLSHFSTLSFRGHQTLLFSLSRCHCHYFGNTVSTSFI